MCIIFCVLSEDERKIEGSKYTTGIKISLRRKKKKKKEKWCQQTGIGILGADVFIKNIEKEIHVPG